MVVRQEPVKMFIKMYFRIKSFKLKINLKTLRLFKMSTIQEENIQIIKEEFSKKPAEKVSGKKKKPYKEETEKIKGGKYSKERRAEMKQKKAIASKTQSPRSPSPVRTPGKEKSEFDQPKSARVHDSPASNSEDVNRDFDTSIKADDQLLTLDGKDVQKKSKSKKAAQQPIEQDTEEPSSEAQPRSKSKEEIVSALLCTRACLFCKRKESGEWGVCFREKCTFAHSLSELQLPICGFGDNCKRKSGPNSCQFKHPAENTEQYYSRTGLVKPDLPETSEQTRKKEGMTERKEKRDYKKEFPVRKDRTDRVEKVEKFAHKDRMDRTDRVERFVHKDRQDRMDRQERHDRVEKVDHKERSQTVETKPQSDRILIHVPSSMKKEALEMCLSKGLTNFQIILTD